jgi:flagellar biosynthesis protein FlhA
VADASTSSPPTTLQRLLKGSDLPFAIGIVGILAVLILPLPTALLSVLLALNLSVSVIILVMTLYTKEPLEFSTFPTLLLITTLFRLGLNVTTTRQILLTGSGGSLIESFGEFVVGGNLVVGMVIFAILIVIQLVVITKGAGRISEVAARFTLDAMPGKQMAIDADLNAGLISEKDARERRAKIASEAEFYGAMDGAGKFVKGDAVAGLIITFINLIAGMIIGMSMRGMELGDAVHTYSLMTIGDGLVSAIPALLISIASGMLVTKAKSESSIGQDLPRQFIMQPRALMVGAGLSAALGIIPGMPTGPFLAIAVGLVLVWNFVRGIPAEEAAAQAAEDKKSEDGAAKAAEEKIEDLLTSDRLAVEIGYRLIPLVDKERGGTLLERITRLRKQMAREHGLLIPPIRVKDNIQLPPGAYRIHIGGQVAASGELQAERLLAIDGGGVAAPVEGTPTKEPAFGLDALWIDPARRSEAEALGWAVTDPASVFITHLTQILRANAHQILNREDVQQMLAGLKKDAPTLVKDIEANVKLGQVQKILGTLLEERVPITNLEKVLEAASDNPAGDPAIIAEHIRARIGRSIVAPFLDAQSRLHAIILHPLTEQRLQQGLSPQGGLSVAPAEAGRLMDRLGAAVRAALGSGREPVLLTTAPLRRPLRQVVMRFHPELAVLSYAELPGDAQVEVSDTLSMNE